MMGQIVCSECGSSWPFAYAPAEGDECPACGAPMVELDDDD